MLVQISSRNASKAYLNMVDNSYLGSCDEVSYIVHELIAYHESKFQSIPCQKFCLMIHPLPSQVTRIMERVEATFIKHFTNGNRREGMKTLRPRARREKHRSTFFLGKTCAIRSKYYLYY